MPLSRGCRGNSGDAHRCFPAAGSDVRDPGEQTSFPGASGKPGLVGTPWPITSSATGKMSKLEGIDALKGLAIEQ